MIRERVKNQRCKLCLSEETKATYTLHQTTLFCCRHCDLHFIDYLDTPTETENTLSPANRHYMEMRQDEDNLLHSARLQLLDQHTHSTSPRLLDVGAGIAQFQRHAADKKDYQTVGIEPSSVRRQYAQEKFGIRLLKECVEDAFWQTNYQAYFDIITLWDVIEHVNDPLATLKNAAKLMKPGGLLAIDTPNRNVFSYRLSEFVYRLSQGRCTLFLDSFYAAAPFGHKQIFTTTQILDLVARSGFKVTTYQHSYTPSALRKNRIILIAQMR